MSKFKQGVKKGLKKPAPVWVAVCIDESGSMVSEKDTVISGFNEFMQDRKKDAYKVPVRVWVSKFNSKSTMLYEGLEAHLISELTDEDYNPNGMTALYDSVGSLIHSIEAKAELEEVQPRIVLVIMTDGEENSSKEYSNNNIKSMLKTRQDQGNWTVTYIGVDMTQEKVNAMANYMSTSAGNVKSGLRREVRKDILRTSYSISNFMDSDGSQCSNIQAPLPQHVEDELDKR